MRSHTAAKISDGEDEGMVPYRFNVGKGPPGHSKRESGRGVLGVALRLGAT
jgi:hypothetical protein